MTPRCPGCGDPVLREGDWCAKSDCWPENGHEESGEEWSEEIEPGGDHGNNGIRSACDEDAR